MSEIIERCVVSCHTHTYLCGHAAMLERKVWHALADLQCMKGIAFCCHNPFLLDDVSPHQRMSFKRYQQFLDCYEKETLYAAQHFPQLQLYLAMEVDYNVPDPEKTFQFIKLTDNYDFVIGAVHSFDLNFLPHSERSNFFETYCSNFKKAIATNWFQIFAHFDIFRQDLGNDFYFENFDKLYKSKCFDCIDFLADHNAKLDQQSIVSLEINASGDPEHMFYPHQSIIHYTHKKGVPLCLSCDAHRPQDVARHFLEVLCLIRNMGVQKLTYYVKKKIQYYFVDDALATFQQLDGERVVQNFLKNNQCSIK